MSVQKSVSVVCVSATFVSSAAMRSPAVGMCAEEAYVVACEGHQVRTRELLALSSRRLLVDPSSINSRYCPHVYPIINKDID